MRTRRVAVLIDGGFYLKRLPKLVDPAHCTTPEQIAESARLLCKRHVQRLTTSESASDGAGRWLDHVYRLFFYDAAPYSGKGHHPVRNQPIDFGKSDTASHRNELFAKLRRKRKFALRLGHVKREAGWHIDSRFTKDVLRIRDWAERIEAATLHGEGAADIADHERRELHNLLEKWKTLPDSSVQLGLRQKGVDMRIGLDIASMALKQQVDTIILVTGDSDFVPAAKLARREGIEFIVDPLWQKVSDDLHEHVDGIASIYPRPNQSAKHG